MSQPLSMRGVSKIIECGLDREIGKNYLFCTRKVSINVSIVFDGRVE